MTDLSLGRFQIIKMLKQTYLNQSYQSKKSNIWLLFFLTGLFIYLIPCFTLANERTVIIPIIDCTYKSLPDEKTDIYSSNGQFTFRLIPEKEQATNDPIASIVVQPKYIQCNASGSIEIHIDDNAIELFSDSSLNQSSSKGDRYHYNKGDRRFFMYFHCDFNEEKEIVLKHTHDNIELNDSKWKMIVQCPNCRDTLSVTADYFGRKRIAKKSRAGYTSVRDIKFNYFGGKGIVYINELGLAGSNCGWRAETKDVSWIIFDSQPSGTGGGAFKFHTKKNNEERFRAGLIEIKLENGEPLDFINVIQDDKILDSITINYPPEVEILNNMPYIEEKDKNNPYKTYLFTATASYIGCVTKTTLTRGDYNLSWSIDSTDYATIDTDGRLEPKYITEDGIVKITAIYRYDIDPFNTKIVKEVKSLKIKDLSVLNKIYIDEFSLNSATEEKSSKLKIPPVQAYFSNEQIPKNVTNQVTWKIFPEIGRIDKGGILTVDSVDIDTSISIKALYTYHDITKEFDFDVMVLDKTRLERIVISGKDNVKPNETNSYYINAHFNNEGLKNVSAELEQFALNAADYNYADLTIEGEKLVLKTKPVDSSKTINIQVKYMFKGVQKLVTKSILIGDLSDWNITIESNSTTLKEGETLFMLAYRNIEGKVPTEITSTASWSIDENAKELASIADGILQAKMVNGDKEIFVSACDSYFGSSKCDSVNIQLTDLTKLDLSMDGPDSLTVGESDHFKVTAILSNEDDNIVTNDCKWSLSPPDYANLVIDLENNLALITAKDIPTDNHIYLSAQYDAFGKSKSISKAIHIKPKINLLVINGPHEVDESSTNHQYSAKAILMDGSEIQIGKDCQWSIQSPRDNSEEIGDISSTGLFSVGKVDKNESTTIEAKYFVQNSEYNGVFPVIINEIPEYFDIKGNVNVSQSFEGDIFVKACLASDETCYSPIAVEKIEWNGSKNILSSVVYKLTVPKGTLNYFRQYYVKAYIDLDLDGVESQCEPKGKISSIISDTFENCDCDLVIPDNCPKAGIALDMDISTHESYIHDSVSSVGIEKNSPRKINAYEVINVGVVAQNVLNLDTFQFDVVIEDTSKIKFISASEENYQMGISSYLKRNGGESIGLMETYSNGVIRIANSLIGKDCLEAPDGSGVIAVLSFRVLDKSGDKRLHVKNVSFMRECDIVKNEKIVNTSSGIILGEDICDLKADFNGNQVVDVEDLQVFANCWLKDSEEPEWNSCQQCNLEPTLDLTTSRPIINFLDLGKFAEEWQLRCDPNNQ